MLKIKYFKINHTLTKRPRFKEKMWPTLKKILILVEYITEKENINKPHSYLNYSHFVCKVYLSSKYEIQIVF